MSPILQLLRKASRIFYLGIDDSMPFEEVQRTFLFNLFLMIGFPFIIPGIPINFSNGQYQLAYMNCALLVLYTAGVYFNITRKHLWMRQVITVLATMVSMTGPVFFRNGTEYNMLINLMSAVILFDNLSFILFSLFIIACVTYVRVRDVNLAAITDFAKASPYINIIWSQFLYVLCVYAFKYIYVKYQKQLELAYEKLKASKQVKDRILQTVTHDLRTPVGGISAVSKILIDSGHELDPVQQKKYLEMIYDTSRQSLNMINELLQQNTSERERAITGNDVVKVINRVVQLMQHKADEKEQLLRINLPHFPLIAIFDNEQIARVLQNLAGNAIKFTRHHGRIEVTAYMLDDEVWVEVTDNGIGIPSQALDTLFEVSSRAKRPGTDGEKSFGIGLSVCRQIIEEHGGRLLVKSEEGKGSVFSFSLRTR